MHAHTMICSVCGKDGASKCCSRCKSSSYVVCNVECQRSDWKRHKREECLVVKVEDGMPAEECSCHRCKAGLTEIGDDDVSDFFNNLHMVRGRKGVWKIIDGKEVRRYYIMHKNIVHTIVSFIPMIHFVSFDSS